MTLSFLPMRASVLALCVMTAPVFASGPATIVFSNSPGWSEAIEIAGETPVTIAELRLDLASPANVLLQFSSELAAESGNGCPCTVMAVASMDDGEQRLLKTANLASPAVQSVDHYDHDRQHLDGSTVFAAPAGRHVLRLIFSQQHGSSPQLIVHLPNVQAIAFPID